MAGGFEQGVTFSSEDENCGLSVLCCVTSQRFILFKSFLFFNLCHDWKRKKKSFLKPKIYVKERTERGVIRMLTVISLGSKIWGDFFCVCF